MSGRRIIGWLLDADDRARLLELIPPAYPRVVAHHVTLKSGAGPDETAPEAESSGVVGVADDGLGVQALVVRIGGVTDRPDGGTWHITWSLQPGRDARESNEVIARFGWTPREPRSIRLTPACL